MNKEFFVYGLCIIVTFLVLQSCSKDFGTKFLKKYPQG